MANTGIDIYGSLRKKALEVTAEQLGLSADQQTLGILMEMGFREGTATLVALADGSVSLYLSNGGGIIGAGGHPDPNQMARRLVADSANFESNCIASEEHPGTSPSCTRFYIVKASGVLTAEVDTDVLGNNRHPLSPLFHAAHALIGEIQKYGRSSH